MYDFKYHKPATVKDAVKILRKNPEAKLLAGGMTLLPTMKQRLASPTDLVDLSEVAELRGIRREGDALVIGAMSTHAEVAGSAEVRSAIPALAALAAHIGDPQVRNRGTLGGSVFNADPAADYPAAIVGLGATVVTNKRRVAADRFFKGMFETALKPGEIIVAVSFPVARKAAYVKFPNPASRYALVGVFVARTEGGVRVAVTGAAPSVFRMKRMEKLLGENFSADAIAKVKVKPANLNADLHASAEYRAHLVTVMAKRAAAAAA